MLMNHYTILVVSSIVIAGLGILIFLRTKNISFPLGLALIYYMTLYGVWAVIEDKTGGDSGAHYAYLEYKMFEVHLDRHYLLAILLYAGFIVLIELAVLAFVRPSGRAVIAADPPVQISHEAIIVISVLAGIFSYLIVREVIIEADARGVSVYDYMRRGFGYTPPLFSLHQILNRVALLPAVVGFVASLSGARPKLIQGQGPRYVPILYMLPIGFMVWLSFLLGYKSELFLSGVMGGLFYLVNAERPRWLVLTMTGVFVVTGMALVDLTRFTPVSNISGMTSLGLVAKVIDFVRTSNEAFAAHFSMYGVLSKDVPFTWGSSLIALVASVVPHFLWPGRPSVIYAYYVEHMDAIPGQGYTIHHATGWYLNFGIPGVIVGALILAAIWVVCYNGYNRIPEIGDGCFRRRLQVIFYAIAPWSFVGYLPFILREGPEIYKGLLVEGFMIPVLIVLLASYWPERLAIFPTGRALPDVQS